MQWFLCRIKKIMYKKKKKQKEHYRMLQGALLKPISSTAWSLQYTRCNWSVRSLQKSINVANTLSLPSTVEIICTIMIHKLWWFFFFGRMKQLSKFVLNNLFSSFNSSWYLLTTRVTYNKQIITSRSTTCSNAFIHA